MLAQGDHQIETHPGLGRRMMVAAGIALCLLLLGLAVTERETLSGGSRLLSSPHPAALAPMSQSAF